MKGQHGNFSENSDYASLCVTTERDNGLSDTQEAAEETPENGDGFESEEDFDSLSAIAPDPGESPPYNCCR